MVSKYKKKTAPEVSERTRDRHPELHLAAEIAGVSYWMAYKVKRGQAQSAKVKKALIRARKKLGLEEAA